MSDILIRGMDMPKNCLSCDWCAHTIPADNYICYRLNRAVVGVAEEDVNKAVDARCPIAIVPLHGRLIDADEMKESIRKQTAFLRLIGGEFAEIAETLEKGFLQEIDNAPTIIPASE